MEFPDGDSTKITCYHAHIYYDDATREKAARLRQLIWGKFDVRMGRFRDRAVGPIRSPCSRPSSAPRCSPRSCRG